MSLMIVQRFKGVTPTPINADDILVIEPCLRPRNGDLVLVRLADKRGVVARLSIDIHSNQSIKYSTAKAEPMPKNAKIEGVVIEIKRLMIDPAIVKARIAK